MKGKHKNRLAIAAGLIVKKPPRLHFTALPFPIPPFHLGKDIISPK